MSERYVLHAYAASPKGRASHWVPYYWVLINKRAFLRSLVYYETRRGSLRAGRRYAERHGIVAVGAELSF